MQSQSDMQSHLPQVGPIGLVEMPQGFVSTPRRYSQATRVVGALVLAAFVFVALATTTLSLTSYCLTSQAGQPLELLAPRVFVR
jgi:hypothetical protein